MVSSSVSGGRRRVGRRVLGSLLASVSGTSFTPVRESCLDFLDSLWTGKGFVSTWDDDELDCEYAFYALLALGHLSL